MPETGSAAAKVARISDPEGKTMGGQTDSYLREQLEKRREELKSAISASAPAASLAPFLELLSEVDSAAQRMENGTYGICDVCKEPVEKERLIADPLVRLCIDHLNSEDRRALERDIELASSIQRGLLPHNDMRFRDWLIQFHYNPAGLVSGDYCDLIPPSTEEGKLVFLLGDVAGKGVGASLLMTHLHAMFRSLSGVGMELEELVEMANRVFCESTMAGQFATLICGRAGGSGDLEIANAGHLPALLVTRSGVQQIGSTGLPLGLFLTSRYPVHHVRLDPGDSLLLFTDGLSEARNPAGYDYGVEGLSRVAGERHGWVPCELLPACLEDVKSFSAGTRQADDQTLMVIHRADSARISLSD
jgi:sigma-B regulation protein RsbU (phosphoserine phosphatase)